MQELEVRADAFQPVQRLRHRDALTYLPRGDQNYAIDVGLRMLELRRIVLDQGGLYRATPANR